MRFLEVLCILILCIVGSNAVLVDDFQYPVDDPITPNPENQIVSIQPQLDPSTGTFIVPVSTTSSVSNLPIAHTLGGSRDILVQITEAQSRNRAEVKAGKSCDACPDAAFSFSVDTNIRASTTVWWDGPDTSIDENFNGLDGVDLTEGGAHDAFRLTVGSSDLNAVVQMIVFTDATHASSLEFNPNNIPQNPQVNVARAITLPFADLVLVAGATAPADLTNVGMVKMVIKAPDNIPLNQAAIDLQIALIETVPVVRVTKIDAVLDVGVSDGIANPGERILYTVFVRNRADLAGARARGVIFVDDPRALSPYLSLVPGTVTAIIGGADSEVDIAPGQPQPIVRKGNTDGDQFVVIEIGDLFDGQSSTITFEVEVLTLPCCGIPICDYPEPAGEGIPTPCQVAGQDTQAGNEGCKCVHNQAFSCSNALEFLDEILINGTAGRQCAPSDDNATTVANPDPTRTPIFASPDPSVTIERTGTGSVIGGSTVDFTITYANNAPRGSAEQTVTVTIPAGTTFAGDSGIWTCNTQTARCTSAVGALAANAGAVTLPYSLTVNTPLGCDSIGFPVDVTIGRTTPANGSCNCRDSNLLNNNDSVSVPIEGTPDVSVTKTYSGPAATANGVVIYSISYTNTGTRLATDTTITETVPENAAYESASSTPGWSCDGNTCTFNVGNVGTGESGTINFAVRVTSVLFCNITELSNTVTIDNTCGDEDDSNNEDTEIVPIEGTPDLAVNVTDSGASVGPGEDITYTITYTNLGTREATNSRVSISVPAHTTFKEGNGFTLTGQRYTLTVGSIFPGESGTATFVVTVDATLPCDVDSTDVDVDITNDCGESDPSDNTDTDNTPLLGSPDLAITKEADVTSVAPGGVITYTLTYSNLGNRDASNVVITDTFDAEVTVEASLSPAFTDCDATSCDASIGDVAAGASGTVVFAVRLASGSECNPGDIVNNAAITNDCGDSDETNNQDSAVVPVTATPNLSLTKVISTNNLRPGTPDATSIVTISYANLGDADATNTVIQFTIPEHTTYNEAESSTGWTCNSATPVVCSYSVGTVEANDVVGGSVLIAFTVDETVDCDVVETGCYAVISNDCGESDPSDNDDEGTIPIEATPVLEVTKDDNGAEFKQRTSVRYDITYGNSGRRGLTNAYLEDQVPENTRVDLGASDAGWECPNGVTGPTTCTKSVGTLNGLSTDGATYIVLSIVDPIPRGLREVTNEVTLDGDTGADLCGGEPVEDDEPTPVIGNPDLTVNKTDLDISVFPGETITYNIMYNNIGERDSTGVTITERVPTHTTFVANSSSPGWSCPDGSAAGTVCTYRHDGSLGTFSPVTIQFAVRVVNPVTCAVTSTTNEVSIRDDGNNGPELSIDNNADNEDTPILGLPNLYVNIDDGIPDNEPVFPGELIRYTINYGHVISGPLASVREATNVVLTTSVPLYTTFVRVESSGAWDCTDGSVAETQCTINAGSLKPSDPARTVTFTVRVVKPFPVGVDSTAVHVEVTNDCGEADDSDNVDDDETPLEGNPDLIIQKHGRCAAFQWNITFGNIGDQVAREVILTSHVPLDTVFNADLSHNLWECTGTQSGSECQLKLGNIAPGETGTISMVTDTLPNSMLTEVVHMTSIHDWRGDDQDPTPDNNRASATISGSGCAECDSCCPPVEECCPDQTHVSFNFQGVLDGLNECE